MIKRGRFAFVLLVISALLCAYGALMAYTRPDIMEYIAPADTIEQRDSSLPSGRQGAGGDAYAGDADAGDADAGAANAGDADVGNANAGAANAGDLGETGDSDGGGPSSSGAVSALTRELTKLYESESELTQSLGTWTVVGMIDGVTVATEDGASATAGLRALGANYEKVYPTFVVDGTLFWPEELRLGGKYALLDEDLSLKLFSSVHTADRTVIIENVRYRVMGVVRHARTVGEPAEFSVYLPLAEVAKAGNMQLHTLTVAARAKAGAFSTLVAVGENWKPRGNGYDARREKMAVTMPLRLGFGICAMFAVFSLARLMLGRWGGAWRRLRDALSREYMSRLWPRALALIALLLATIGVSGALGLGVMSYLVQPVYRFTEWVPAVLVEPGEIAKTFWNLQTRFNATVELRTPLVMSLRLYAGLVNAGAIGTLIAALVCALRWKKGAGARG